MPERLRFATTHRNCWEKPIRGFYPGEASAVKGRMPFYKDKYKYYFSLSNLMASNFRYY